MASAIWKQPGLAHRVLAKGMLARRPFHVQAARRDEILALVVKHRNQPDRRIAKTRNERGHVIQCPFAPDRLHIIGKRKVDHDLLNGGVDRRVMV